MTAVVECLQDISYKTQNTHLGERLNHLILQINTLYYAIGGYGPIARDYQPSTSKARLNVPFPPQTANPLYPGKPKCGVHTVVSH